MSDRGGSVRNGGRDLPRPGGASVLVAGTVRNGANHVAADVARIGAALRGFARVQWLLIESDSTDETLGALATLAGRIEGFRHLSLGRLVGRLPRRTERLAFCRNTYLEELRTNPRYAGVDLVLIADLDAANSLLSESALLSCWQQEDWDVCTANQQGPYFDIWALRHPDWSPNDCWAQYRFLTQNGVGAGKAWRACVRARMVRIRAEASWIEVDSAFGGLAVYRRRALDHGEYVGRDQQGNEICEHVPLHQKLRAHGSRIFINPALLNALSAEHMDRTLFGRRMRRVVRQLRARVTA
jgi:hypothetical protein